MKKVLIIGSSGAGKSTFAKHLHKITGLKLIHLDQIYWQPNWIEPEKDGWKNKLEKTVREDSWIMDGNFSSTLDIRLPACDTVIFLEMPRAVCVFRILKRVAFSYKKTRSDMAEDCPEKFDWKFIKWVWDFKNRSKLKMEILLKKFENEKIIIRLKSKREVEKFFMDLEANKVKS